MSHFHNSVLIGSSGQGAEFEITRSLRFNSADSAYLSRTPSSAGNRKTWTWSGWVKRCQFSTLDGLFFQDTGTDDTNYGGIFFNTDGTLAFNGWSTVFRRTSAVYRDPSAWMHIVVACDTTLSDADSRMRFYVNGTEITDWTTKNTITQNADLSINKASEHRIGRVTTAYANQYLTEIHFVDGQQLAASDFGEYDDNNVWQPKAYSGSYGTNGFYLKFVDNSSNAALGTDSSGNDNTWTVNNLTVTTPTVTTSSITSATAFNTNYNSYLTSMTLDSGGDAAPYRSGTTSDVFDNSVSTGIRGAKNDSGDAEIEFTFPSNLISVTSQVRVRAESITRGVALIQCTIGGTTTSYTWQNIGNGENRWYSFSGSGSLTRVRVYNNNDESGLSGPIGLYQIEVDGNVLVNESGTDLEFTDNTNFSSIVVDAQTTNTGSIVSKDGSASPPTIRVSGGTWSSGDTLTQAVIVGDDLKDSPINSTDSSDDPVGNYATLNPLSGFGTLSNGNLDNTGSAADWRSRPGTIGMSSGKWYFEWTHGGGTHIIGIGTSQIAGAGYVGDNAYGYGYYSANGQKYNSGTGSAYGNTWTTGDIIGVAFDADAGNLYFYKNGTAQNSGTAAFTGLTSGPYFPVIGLNGTSSTGSINFGQAPFNFTPPTGYVSLCTQNLADPTIADGSTAFEARTYAGVSGASSQTGYNFGPDFLWIKRRNSTNNHSLFDTVRGAGYVLQTNNRDNQKDNTAYMTAFTSDGYSFGLDGGDTDAAGGSYVAWAWDGGTSTASNTDGSITSSVRASASNGFSIVKYVGTGANATVGHGLNAAPDWIIFKDINRNDEPWFVYHSALGSSAILFLNTTAAQTTGQSDFMNSTDPTNSVFSLGNAIGKQNRSGSNFLALCWAAVEGYSAFGSYTGNGSTDGPFVFTGHRSQFLLVKQSSASGEDWWIVDTARETFNPQDQILLPNSNNSEITTTNPIIDILSNGFKLRNTNARFNASGATYIYASFASSPFKAARAR